MIRRKTFDDEAKMQPFMDMIYRRWGYNEIRERSCRAFDVELVGALPENSHHKSAIEEKYLFVDNPYNQMLVEIMQDVKSANLGWFYHCRAPWLAWMYCPESRVDPPYEIHFIKWPVLKQLVITKLESSKWANVSIVKDGFGLTVNVPIRFDDIPEAHHYKYYWQDFADRGF